MKSSRVRRALVVLLAALVAVAAVGPIGIALREGADGKALPSTVRGRLIQVGGHRVHIVDQGSGAPLLLVHGFGASTFDYEESVLEALARSHRVIAVDLYGFGWSERNGDFAYGLPLWADQLAGVLDALGLDRASVAGHSMGGAAAAVFAARHPSRIDKLILADALYPQEDSEIPLTFRALRTPVIGELGLGLVGDLSPPGASPANRAHIRAFTSITGTRRAWLGWVRDREKRAQLRAAYEKIAAPALVLHGTADAFVTLATMQRAAQSIRGARIVPLAGGTHFPHRDAADTYVRQVEAFLAEPAAITPPG
jgi:2-hydroxymuconate-semialdehyde hydrolase